MTCPVKYHEGCSGIVFNQLPMVAIANRRILPPHDHERGLHIGLLDQVDIEAVRDVLPQTVFQE